MAKHNIPGITGEITFNGSPDDFVELVRLMEQLGGIINMDTRLPATRQEIAAQLMRFMEVDLGGYNDYQTLELCSNGSDFGEKMLQAMQEFRDGDLRLLLPGSDS